MNAGIRKIHESTDIKTQKPQCMGSLDPYIVLISLIPALHIKVLYLHMEVLHMELITSRLRNCNHNVWIFLIPAFSMEVLHMQHHSWVFLMPVFIFLIPAFSMEVLHMQHHSWVFLMPVFMDHPDACVHGSS